MPWSESLDGAIDAVMLYSVSLFGLREMAESSRMTAAETRDISETFADVVICIRKTEQFMQSTIHHKNRSYHLCRQHCMIDADAKSTHAGTQNGVTVKRGMSYSCPITLKLLES